MNSQVPFIPGSNPKKEEKKPSSRFIDEKISDETGTETKAADSALAPAGLKNPFWN